MTRYAVSHLEDTMRMSVINSYTSPLGALKTLVHGPVDVFFAGIAVLAAAGPQTAAAQINMAVAIRSAVRRP